MLEVFKQVIVRGEPRQLSELVAQITRDPATGWARNSEREPPGKPKLEAGHDIAVFRWGGGPTSPASDLFIVGRGDRLEVTNIVPVDVPRLSRTQYNTSVDDFVKRNVSKRARALQLNVEVTPDHLPITHWLTGDAAGLLTAFSKSANRSILHPLDAERWRAFLIRAHLDQTTLDTETLFRWLTEEERWPEDKAESLILEFEFALQLLSDFDNRRL